MQRIKKAVKSIFPDENEKKYLPRHIPKIKQNKPKNQGFTSIFNQQGNNPSLSGINLLIIWVIHGHFKPGT